ncbi:MAG: hypothetical protein WC495_03900 [Patescibacteria group bacterium]|jgi:hypothetical protein
MIKSLHIITLIAVSSLLFVGAASVMAESTGFVEPGQGTTLAVPLSTSSAPQAIDTALGVGVDTIAEIPNNATFFVQGSTVSKPQGGSGRIANVFIDKTPTDTSDGTTFSIQGSRVQILGSGATCSQNARVCVMETADGAAVDVLQQTGVGLFGETSVAGKAGVYGQGYYGVEALASGDSNETALKAQSCTVSGGLSSYCTQYGTAGFFNGDFVISDQGSANTVTGALNGNGENLYRVQSLYNLQEGTTPTSKGIAFKSFGVVSPVQIGAGATYTLTTGLDGVTQSFISIDVVEGDGSVFRPANYVEVSYNPTSHDVILHNTSLSSMYIRAVVSYLIAAN